MSGKSLLTLLAGCALLSACEKQSQPLSQAEPPALATPQPVQATARQGASAPQPADPPKPLSAAGNPAYDRVTSNLDAGGVIYLYWSMDKALGELNKKFESVRDTAVSEPNLTPNEKKKLRKNFELGIRFILASGLQGMKAFGLSSKEVETGIFLNKTYTYFPDRSGFLWDTFAKTPHDFAVLNMIPENTEGLAFYDFDLDALWRAVSKELTASEIPEVKKSLEQLPQQVQAYTGLTLADLLASLDDQVGVFVTLDPKTKVQVPVGNQPYEMPEPAGALVWKVKNDKLFDRLDALFNLNPKVEKTDEPKLRMRVLRGVTGVTYVSPTMARFGEYLIISSSDKLVRAMTDTQSGKMPGIKSSPDFAKLSAGLPEKGNSVAYFSKVFQKTVADLQTKYSQIRDGGNPLLEGISARFSGMWADVASYTVGGAAEDGWFTTAKSTKDVNEIFGEFLALPAYYLAIAAVDEMKQGRENDKLAKVKQNLADLRAAKDEAISEKNLEGGQMLTRQDVEEYLTTWPQSVVGETYEVGTVGQPPYATAPVDLGNYAAGTKIEP